MFIVSPFIANNLLKEPKTYYLLIAMALTLPFSSIACIFKGYFYGIQKNYPHVLSNTVEQLIRLILILTVIPKLIEISYVHAAVGLILTFLFTEAASIIVFSICMNKKDVKTMYKLSYSKSDIKDILNLSIPTVTSRIIGNICYFFEPIILTNILLYKGYSHYFILTEYGAYNAYAISTLTIPSFFISAISLALIPEISKYNENNNTYYVKKRLKEACIYTFIIGLISTFCIFIFRNELLFFLYKTTLGTDYIKLLAPFFILFYFVVVNAVKDEKSLNILLHIFVFSATIASIYGLHQYVYGDLYSQAWLDKNMFESIKMRVYSTFENPNVFGEYLLLVGPINFSFLFEEKKILKKLIAFGMLSINTLTLILTFSRGCWLGILFAIAILLIVIDRRFILLGILALLVAPFVLPETIISRFTSIGNMGDTSTSYRVAIWMGTIAMLKDYWFSGIGLGITSFNKVYPIYAYAGTTAQHSHNLYLQLMVENGIMGLVMFLGIIYNFFKEMIISLVKKKKILLVGIMSGMVGFLVQSMTDHTWYNYRVVLIFWMVVAFGVSYAKIIQEEK